MTLRCLYVGVAWAVGLGTGCAETPTAHSATAPLVASVSQVERVIPGPGLPSEVEPLHSNNNLDVVRFDGRVFLAFRTAPDHFAGTQTEIQVVSSADEKSWQYEMTLALGTDLREPRFLAFKDRLWLYVAVLGKDSADFEPQGTLRLERLGVADWTDSEPFYEETFIPWRARSIGDTAYVIGYTGGANVYRADGPPVQVHWLASSDGVSFAAAAKSGPVVLEGGVSETDFSLLDDGSLVAVARNEAGDVEGFGSKICRASVHALGQWTCRADKRKFDSPLLFRKGSEVFLIGRRNVSETGNFDLDLEGPKADRYLLYQASYATKPKRCSLWRVDPDSLEVSFMLDLPSRGDTCFASHLTVDEATETVYNYSSPLDGDDVPWIVGQQGPTHIYRQTLKFSPL